MKVKGLVIGNIREVEYNCLKTTHSMHCDLGFGCSIAHHDIKTHSYKNDALLIKINNSGYVDVDNINSILDIIKIKRHIKRDGIILGGPVLSDTVHPFAKPGDLFIEYNSIKECEIPEGYENKSIWQLSKYLKNNHCKKS